MRRVAALGTLLALGLAAVGGWGTALSGGLAGPVAGPLALHLPGRLASGTARGLPAVIKACRKEAAPFREMAAKGREGALWPVTRLQDFWRWKFPTLGLGVGGLEYIWPDGAVLESWTPFGTRVGTPKPLTPHPPAPMCTGGGRRACTSTTRS